QASMVGGEPHQVQLLHVRVTPEGRPGPVGPYATDRSSSLTFCSTMPERGRQPALLEKAKGPNVLHVDHDRPAVIAVAQIGDDAVRTRVGAGHHTVVTVDAQHRFALFHAPSVTTGCDSQAGGGTIGSVAARFHAP